MNTIEQLRELYHFNDWANRRVVFALRDANSEKALQSLAHILITEKEYFERLYGKDSTGFNFWPHLSREECKQLAMENAESYLHLLKGFDDEGLDLSTSYKTSEGISERNTYREMLTHVLFHSMSHRGQINTILRQEGFEPIANDYIIYLRNS
ncbi:MAG TPA: DinB family protein [Pyrinomonadaceae bacterium]|nr:DinB family protein [Pyrinomonadaceae bacterium]